MTTCLEKELFIRFTVYVFRERLSICVCPSFPFDFEGGMWDLIAVIPDHCLSIYFSIDKLLTLLSYLHNLSVW